MTRVNALTRAPRASRAAVRAGIGVACLALVALVSVGMPSAVAGAPAPAVATPTCKEWQTITQVPVPGSRPPATGADGSTPTAEPRTTPVCRNAPPKPFPAPTWAPDTVVGGARLAESGVVVDLPVGVVGPPPVPDVSYVVADLDTGEVLAAKAPHAWLRPASTLKALTALTLIPRLDPKTVVTAMPEHQAANGSRVGMLAGNPYPVGTLFDAMLMFSANDAVYALADAAGGYEETLALMNETAASVGAYDTVAKDPSGLDEDGQHSSAYDLALIGRAAMALPDFRRYIVKRDAVFPGGKAQDTGTVYKPFHIYNINDLLAHYPGAIGIKPGRTNRAQHTFIGAATRGGRSLIVTQMGSTTGDWEDTAALLDWGFANAGSVHAVGRLVVPGEASEPEPAPTVAAEAPTALPSSASAAGPPAAAIGGGGSALGQGPIRADFASVLVLGAVSLLGVVIIGLAWFGFSRRSRR